MRMTIDDSEYIKLLERSNLLQALFDFGVEEWHGFSEARMSLLEREEQETGARQLELTEKSTVADAT